VSRLLRRNWIRVAAVMAVVGWSPAAGAERVAVRSAVRSEEHVSALSAMMADMTAESRGASARIQDAYRAELEAALADRSALIASLESGHVALLPENPRQFNVHLRLAGDHPIAERDLVYQPLYVAARPATIGALLTVASRVESGPIEVTSLVRHAHYQRLLQQTNRNALTAVPTHTLGLAFDVSILNAPLETALEIRDVLRAMAADGDLFVVAETRQFVFHVVPAPERLPFFEAVYDALIATHATW
jgi:hypothetical protein